MAVHLIGGGWAADESTWTGRFLADAAARSDRTPQLAVVLWSQTAAEGEQWHDEYRADFAALGPCTVRIVQLTPERPLRAADLHDVDGIFVGGGLTPGYYEAVMPAADAIRAAVADGVPYAGYSAGAMIAGDHALLGGWQVGGVSVCSEDSGEGLSEVSLAPGLGLVAPVVDVHTAQQGLLSRAVAIVAAGRACAVIAVDECTSAIIADDLVPAGLGAVWLVDRTPGGVQVRRLTAAG